MYAYAPTGSPILGTLENCPARAELLHDSYGRDADGKLTYEHAGGSEMFYDEMQTAQRDGEDIYLDEDGSDWKESEIALFEKEPTEDEIDRMANDYMVKMVAESTKDRASGHTPE